MTAYFAWIQAPVQTVLAAVEPRMTAAMESAVPPMAVMRVAIAVCITGRIAPATVMMIARPPAMNVRNLIVKPIAPAMYVTVPMAQPATTVYSASMRVFVRTGLAAAEMRTTAVTASTVRWIAAMRAAIAATMTGTFVLVPATVTARLPAMTVRNPFVRRTAPATSATGRMGLVAMTDYFAWKIRFVQTAVAAAVRLLTARKIPTLRARWIAAMNMQIAVCMTARVASVTMTVNALRQVMNACKVNAI